MKARLLAAMAVAALVWLTGFAYFKIRPDLAFRGAYFIFSDGGQYLWVVDQLQHGRRLYTDIHWYYGIIPLWAYRAWALVSGNSAQTYGLYTLSGMAVNAGLACWWLSRLMSLRRAVAGVCLTLAPWLVRNALINIHVPWELTSLLLLACAWQPVEKRSRLRQAVLGVLLVTMVMIKMPLMLAGGFALFVTDLVMVYGPGGSRLPPMRFVGKYWLSVATAAGGLGLYFAWMWWMIGNPSIWFDTAFPLYMTKAYASIGDPPAWNWQGGPYFLFNQLPIALAIAGAVLPVLWALTQKGSRWLEEGGLIMPVCFICGPLSVIRQTPHLLQYYWMGLLGLAVCLPLMRRFSRWAAAALLLLISTAIPYKLVLQPKTTTLQTLDNGQSLWLTEAEQTQWNAMIKAWKTHRTEERKAALVFEIGAGTYFYAQMPQPFRQYYYYPGFVRPYDIDWLVAHRDEFCGAVVTGNKKRLDFLTEHLTQKEWLHQDANSTDDRIKLGPPDRVDERCLFVPFVPSRDVAGR